MSTWFDSSMVVRTNTVRVNGRGVVACIIVVLVQKVTEECLKWDTLIASGVRGVQDEGTQVLERNGNVNIGGVACLLTVGIGTVNVEVDAITVQVMQCAVA